MLENPVFSPVAALVHVAVAGEVAGQLVFALLRLLRSIPAHLGHLPALSTQLHTNTGLCTNRTWYLQTKVSPAVSSLPSPPFAYASPMIRTSARLALESQHSQAPSVRANTKHNLLALDQLFALRVCYCLAHKPARPYSTCAACTANIKPTAAFQPSPQTPRSRGCCHLSIPQMLLGIP